jgi:formate hydrogenlyase subunit 3/multisubunit Na+/H+ antiporter MnhD subunit
LTGALVIVVTHLCLAPILLRSETSGLFWPRRVAWALLSGVPPSPTFWGRLLLLEALAAGNVGSTIAAVIAMALIFVATVMACSTRVPLVSVPGWRGRLPELAAWLLLAVGIAIGLAPQSLTRFVFGS